MLQLQNISLTQFKNYTHRPFAFSKKIVGICGNNGIGKTNLLDAIYYLCFTKSYFTNGDGLCVMQGRQGFRVSGTMSIVKVATVVRGDTNHGGRDTNQGDEGMVFRGDTNHGGVGKEAMVRVPTNHNDAGHLTITCILRETGKKEFTVNDELYSRTSKHIGRLPCVIIAPDDVELILGGSEERRRFIDTLLCQLNPEYLQQLIDYNKLLQQRNSLLKRFAEQGRTDASLLEVMNDQLSNRGHFIYTTRQSFLQTFLPQVAAHYHAIAQQDEPVELRYRSQLHEQPMNQLLVQTIAKDMALQRTTTGTHRDDLELLLSNQPFKQIASQGQRKSLLFALKLTEFETLQQQKGFAPILLLDDVFEKLDAGRMENLLKEVCIEKGGQVFITDTHRERLEKNLTAIGADFEIIEI
jgi:DNA replication and repair protein RecF